MERLSDTKINTNSAAFNLDSQQVIEWAEIASAIKPDDPERTLHIGTEHLLYGLTFIKEVREVLAKTGISPYKIQRHLKKYIAQDKHAPEIVDGMTKTTRDAINNAKLLAARDGSDVTPLHLYAGIVEAEKGYATILLCYYLSKQNPEMNTNYEALQTQLFRYIE